MADARTLPSDLFIPEVAQAAAGVEFVDSLQAFKLMGTGPDAPIRLVGFENLTSGGQFIKKPIISEISSLESRRDLTSQADVDTKKFATREDRGVLCNRKIGPVSVTNSAEQLSILGNGQLSVEFGRQAARNVMRTIQSLAINAMFGAVNAVSGSANTKSVWNTAVRTNLDSSLLAQIEALSEDSDKRIVGWIFRSESYKIDLRLAQLGAGVAGIADEISKGLNPHTLGLMFAIVNDSILKAADGGFDKYYTLGLTPGAIEIEITRPLVIYNPEQRLKSENVELILRGDYDIAIHVPGLAFSTGVANPTAANLSTSGNWTYNAADHREVGIYLGEHNYSAA